MAFYYAPPSLVSRFLLFLVATTVTVTLAQSDGIPEQCQTFAGPAHIVGNKFYDTRTGQYRPVIGINYYPRPNAGFNIGNNIDFYTEEYRHVWSRDIPLLEQLGVNTIRIFAVDPSKNHDAFMCRLKASGISVILGLSANCDGCNIPALGVTPPACYPASLKTRGQFIIAEWSRYDNLLAFSVSNEINLRVVGEPEVNAPCAKQFVRDMRAYVQGCGNDPASRMRHVPIGIATADRDREANGLYYNCRSDPDDDLENAEWFGLNAYRHCDGSVTSLDDMRGWIKMREDFEAIGMSIPTVLTEFGCINESFPTIDGFAAQRNFLQIEALYSELYSQQFAGGCVFEYLNEERKANAPWPYTTFGTGGNFGVGYFDPEFCTDVLEDDMPCSFVKFPQFATLAAKLRVVDVSFVPPVAPATTLNSDEDNPFRNDVTECPEEFEPLSSFDWPSAGVEDWQCPPALTVYCPGIPLECLTTPAPTMGDGTTGAPATVAPSIAPTESMDDDDGGDEDDEDVETDAPVAAETTESPTTEPTTEDNDNTPAPTPVPTATDDSDDNDDTPAPTPAPTATESTDDNDDADTVSPTTGPTVTTDSTLAPTAATTLQEDRPTTTVNGSTSASIRMQPSAMLAYCYYLSWCVLGWTAVPL